MRDSLDEIVAIQDCLPGKGMDPCFSRPCEMKDRLRDALAKLSEVRAALEKCKAEHSALIEDDESTDDKECASLLRFAIAVGTILGDHK